MKKITILLVIFLSHLTFAQEVDIIEVTLQDTILKKVIKDFIKERTDVYPVFQDKGFITVWIEHVGNNSNNDTIRAYAINDQYYDLRIDDDKLFPLYYSYIAGKLVLIYFQELDKIVDLSFSKKSKKRLLKKMDAYLNEKIHLKLKDENGNVVVDDKNFRDTSYNLHGGIKLYVTSGNKYIIDRGK